MPRLLRPNPGHSVKRQLMAPQPDAGPRWGGQRPMDHLRRNVGTRSIPNHPVGSVGNRMGGGYGQMLDRMNPNHDRPLPGGMNDAQVEWMKQNLLGRTGDVTGREGPRFQQQMARYIQQAGGQQAFSQMLSAMPGFGRRGDVPGGERPNTFDPIRGRIGPQNPNQRPPDPMFPEQRAALGLRDMPGKRGPAGNPQGMGVPQATAPVLPGSRGMGDRPPRSVEPQTAGFTGDLQHATHDATRENAVSSSSSGGIQQHADYSAEVGRRLATEPLARASALAYKGETDPQRQKEQDRKFFAERGVPLTPEVEEGMRQLTDQWLEALIDIGYAEADAAAKVNTEKERLVTDFLNQGGRVDSAAADAGLFNSSIRRDQQLDLGTQYGRAFQDLATGGLQAQRDIANARAAAQELMRAGREELAMQGTRQAVSDAASGNPYAGLPTSKNGHKRRSRSRRRSEREKGR